MGRKIKKLTINKNNIEREFTLDTDCWVYVSILESMMVSTSQTNYAIRRIGKEYITFKKEGGILKQINKSSTKIKALNEVIKNYNKEFNLI